MIEIITAIVLWCNNNMVCQKKILNCIYAEPLKDEMSTLRKCLKE